MKAEDDERWGEPEWVERRAEREDFYERTEGSLEMRGIPPLPVLPLPASCYPSTVQAGRNGPFEVGGDVGRRRRRRDFMIKRLR